MNLVQELSLLYDDFPVRSGKDVAGFGDFCISWVLSGVSICLVAGRMECEEAEEPVETLQAAQTLSSASRIKTDFTCIPKDKSV